MYTDVFESIQLSFVNMANDVVAFLPLIVAALLILIVGWIFGNLAKKGVRTLFTKLKVNQALASAGVDTLTERAGLQLKAGVFVGMLVKWFIIAVFFVAALDVLQLTMVTEFIRDVVLGYLPNVIVAVLILLVASVVAGAASTAVTSSMRAASASKPEFLGKVTYYAIIVFAVLAALNQLRVAPELVQMMFAGLVFAAALALGLSFGLGGRETAAKYLDKMTGRHNQ